MFLSDQGSCKVGACSNRTRCKWTQCVQFSSENKTDEAKWGGANHGNTTPGSSYNVLLRKKKNNYDLHNNLTQRLFVKYLLIAILTLETIHKFHYFPTQSQCLFLLISCARGTNHIRFYFSHVDKKSVENQGNFS